MMRFIFALIVAFLVAVGLVALRAEELSQSAAPAASVKALLEQLKMDSVAARIRKNPVATLRPSTSRIRSCW